MLGAPIRRADGEVRVDPGRRGRPPLPVDPALAPLLPGGLRRGSTVTVAGSVSLLLALLGAASAGGAWCALVGFPHVSAEAAAAYGVVLPRLAIVPAPGPDWATAVGALVDAVDIVAVRPPARPADGLVRRLAARARARDAVLVPFLPGSSPGGPAGRDGEWPGADIRLHATPGPWTGIGDGTGRLRARRVEVTAAGKGCHRVARRPATAGLWLPTATGGVSSAEPLAPVIPLVG